MSKLRNVTGILILGTLVAWGVYDLVPAIHGPDGSTISEVLQDYGAPPVWLGVGYLLGHFWPTKQALEAIWGERK